MPPSASASSALNESKALAATQQRGSFSSRCMGSLRVKLARIASSIRASIFFRLRSRPPQTVQTANPSRLMDDLTA